MIKKAVIDGQLLDSKFKPEYEFDDLDERPISSFCELMSWVNRNFNRHLSTQNNLTNLVHNKVIIDDDFLIFAQEKKLEIECLYKDSIVSWIYQEKYEKFFVQGVFRIYSNDVEFLASALYHKGNSFEDEVSFFVVCDSSKFDSYLNLRNEYDKWLQIRDRNNNEITVIDGENIPISDETWDDLFLPDSLKLDIKSIVEVFLSSKDWYLKNKIPWKKGLFLHGVQGNGKTSIIKTVISQYPFKAVTVAPGSGTDIVGEAFRYAQSQSPSLLYFEDLDSLLNTTVDPSAFLNLMDGVSTKNGLFVIATANRPELLAANITDRPSRFDRKIEVPIPDRALSKKYLLKWFGKNIKLDVLNNIVDQCVKQKFTYAYLKELYVASMYKAISKNKQVPTKLDIYDSLKNIISERNNMNNLSGMTFSNIDDL